MFKYRVLSSKMMGNAKRKYTILDLRTNEVFEKNAAWISAQEPCDFINVNFSRTHTGYNSFHIIKTDKTE